MSKLFLFNGCSYASAAGKGLYKQKCSVYAVSRLCCSYAVVPEQKARTTYDNLLRLIDDPDILEPLRFLRQREIVHYQRFGEAKREDCSKIQRREKPTNSALLESHYQSEHLQDIGMSRPICCYTSK